jgi:hypothetical protein
LRKVLKSSKFGGLQRLPERYVLEAVLKPQIRFKGKAQADEKAQHTWRYVSPAIGGKEACDAPLKYYQ